MVKPKIPLDVWLKTSGLFHSFPSKHSVVIFHDHLKETSFSMQFNSLWQKLEICMILGVNITFRISGANYQSGKFMSILFSSGRSGQQEVFIKAQTPYL